MAATTQVRLLVWTDGAFLPGVDTRSGHATLRRSVDVGASRHADIGVNLDTLRWAEAPVKIARMTLTVKLDRNWSSFQLANSAPPLSVTDSAIAPSARMQVLGTWPHHAFELV